MWNPTAVFQDAFEYYKEVARERFGWDAGPEHCIGSRYLHVAETTEQAIAECREAVMYVRRLTTFSRPVQVPAAVPGIQTDRSFDYRKRSRGAEMPAPGTPFEKLRETGFIVCGDPDYVSRMAGAGHADRRVWPLPGDVPGRQQTHEHVMKSKRLFAEHVIPRLRHINETSSYSSAGSAGCQVTCRWLSAWM